MTDKNITPENTMLIFDLDGTLWDSSEEVAESWNIIIRKYYPERANLKAGDIQAVMGKTMEEIAEISFPDMPIEERKKLFDECQSFEVDHIKEHGGKLFKGVEDTLRCLKEKGFKMAVVSNCQVGYIGAFFESMKMHEYFCDFEEWGRTLQPKSHNIRLVMERNGFENAIYIGDTEKDMLACRDAKVPFIHAAYGFGEVEAGVSNIKEFTELSDLI